MADVIDAAQERADLILESQIQAARISTTGASSMYCLDCDRPIPEERRAALPGVDLCVCCKEISELNAKHYRESK